MKKKTFNSSPDKMALAPPVAGDKFTDYIHPSIPDLARNFINALYRYIIDII